jgi:cell wall-associated NlpC family hydrolase
MKLRFKIFCSYKSLISYGLAVLTAFFLLSACAAPSKHSSGAIAGSARSQVAIDEVADTEIEKLLRQEYRKWKGTRHRLGGTGSRGIDCSGFVKTVYKDVFNIDLPRTTKAQVRRGRPIPFEALQAGDLVFFQPPSYPRHVGIYLGGSEFVHASKNKGVTLSKIDPTYWGKYYWTARRILSAAESP